MAITITADVQEKLEQFFESLHVVQNLTSIFTSAPPAVDAEPFQYLFERAVNELSERFDTLCQSLDLPH